MIIKAAVNGLGTVNTNLMSIIEEKKYILRRDYDIEFKFVCIADSSGIALNNHGFNPTEVALRKEDGEKARNFVGYKPDMSMSDALEKIECDLVFEGSPVDHKTGGEALDIVKAALKNGISVVLANKGPVVCAHGELHKLAAENNAQIKYSATVCGGLPVLNIGERDMIAGDIHKIRGVFNGTSNFIFAAMIRGQKFDDALKVAQDVGAAEADPSLDIDGWDTAFKLLIIVNSVLKADISLDDIEVEGISTITPELLREEYEAGHTVKLVATAQNGVYTVKPTVLAREGFLGSCDGWEMGVEIHSDIYGISYHKLYEKEPIPTAASMMRDAVNIFS